MVWLGLHAADLITRRVTGASKVFFGVNRLAHMMVKGRLLAVGRGVEGLVSMVIGGLRESASLVGEG